MALQLITGSCGAGKSHTIYQKIIEESIQYPNRNYLIIVPEQYTMQTQQKLVELHPEHSVLNIDILSFQRLAYRVFGEVGGNLQPLLDDIGKTLVLQKIAQSNKKQLKYLGGSLKKSGYIEEMKSMLSELEQYRIKAADMDQLIERAEEKSLLKGKLQDIQVIYQQFEEYLQDRYVTSEEILDVLCRVIGRSDMIKGSTVVLDGFTGFTPVQNQVVEKLLCLCRQVYVTVTIDHKQKSYHLFQMSEAMIKGLHKMAAGQNIEIMEAITVDGKQGRLCRNEVLQFLEKNLFRRKMASFHKKQEALKIYEAANPLQEMELVAGKIHHLIRNNGYRYKDIAVVTGDLEGYESYLAQVFDKEGIPFFLDRKQSVLLNPFVEYIRAALEMVVSSFSYESVFRYLRTGMSNITSDKTDLLENYVLANGIRGWKRWNEEFSVCGRKGKEDLICLNEIRKTFVEEVGVLTEEMRSGDKTAGARTTALYHFIVHSEVQRKLKEREELFKKLGKPSLVKEYAQIYGIIMGLFDKIVEVLGDEKISLRDYQQLLEAGFAKLKVGIIPPTVDQIIVGDVERSRLPEIKVLFFVGVNDGVIPKRSEKGGILTENEREYLKANDVELAPTAREDMSIQQFYLYLNLTKPSQRLYLSFSHMKADGGNGGPAYLIHTIRKLFPLLEIKGRTQEPESAEEGFSILVSNLVKAVEQEEDDSWRELFGWFLKHPEYQKRIRRILEAAYLENPMDHIGHTVARALYGKVLENSATRLERFAACAFAHFLQYGLHLEERAYYEFKPMDLGNVLHEALERFSQLVKKEKLSWKTISDEQQRQLADQCLQKVLEKRGYDVLGSTARNQYIVERLRRLLYRSVWALKEQLACGEFEPGGFEVSFTADSLEALKFPIAEDLQLRLQGRIDRVDICENGEECYVKVVDYKSGKHSLDLVEVYHGISLQLVVYLNAAMELVQNQYPDKNIRPAGIFYYQIQDPLIQGTWEQEQISIDEGILKELRMQGLANGSPEILDKLDHNAVLRGKNGSLVFPLSYNKDGSVAQTSAVAMEKRFQIMSEYVNEKIVELGTQILDGDAKVSPYRLGNKSGCDYCPYASVCGFDEKISGYQYRKLTAFSDEEVWNRMERRNADGSKLDEGTTGSNQSS